MFFFNFYFIIYQKKKKKIIIKTKTQTEKKETKKRTNLQHVTNKMFFSFTKTTLPHHQRFLCCTFLWISLAR